MTPEAMTFNSSLDLTSGGEFESTSLHSHPNVFCHLCLLAFGKPTQSLKIYDTLLSAGQEYKCIWKSKWSLVKVLYICARYGAFIDVPTLVHARISNSRFGFCLFAGVGMGVTEIILMIRTYAQYDKSKKLLAFFLLLWLVSASINAWDAIQWTKSFIKPNALAVRFYVIMLGIETVFLTLWKGFQTGCNIST
ncbi:hypothetical protein GGX14DRAFT_409209 [Mycena pura]|uniref:DUF6533 domain-containing protein n=1 Tax=Mycena pura TaxID=153505 RepID=A0AAD6UMM8_9AGAR|nr:hypothetical protein GGX14DRAFT_409209 [Mycena pura]